MVICREVIREYILRRHLATPILDLDEQTKGRASLDVRLGHQFIVFNKATGLKAIDPSEGKALEAQLEKHHQSMIRIGYGQQFYLHPGDFVIARTFEYISMPDQWMAYVVGRSSWGRLGVVIATATFINPGFKGTITLEIANLGQVPVSLQPLIRIAQLVFHKVESDDGVRRVPSAKVPCGLAPEAH